MQKYKQKRSKRDDMIGLAKVVLDMLIPFLIAIGVVIFWVFPLVVGDHEEDYIFPLALTNVGALGTFFYLIFYNGPGALLSSLKSSTTLISYNGQSYAVDTSGGNVNIRASHGTGLALLLILVKLLINLAVISIMFVKNIVLFIICLFIPTKRIEMIENGHEAFDRLKETRKFFIVFFGVTIATNLITFVLLLCAL